MRESLVSRARAMRERLVWAGHFLPYTRGVVVRTASTPRDWKDPCRTARFHPQPHSRRDGSTLASRARAPGTSPTTHTVGKWQGAATVVSSGRAGPARREYDGSGQGRGLAVTPAVDCGAYPVSSTYPCAVA